MNKTTNCELVKGSGGAVTLTENPLAFRKWLLTVPEQLRLLKEFENELVSEETTEHHHHHDDILWTGLYFVDTINDKDNSFPHNSRERLVRDTESIINEFVVHTVPTVEAIGSDQCNDYHKSTILERAHSIYDPIKENSIHVVLLF